MLFPVNVLILFYERDAKNRTGERHLSPQWSCTISSEGIFTVSLAGYEFRLRRITCSQHLRGAVLPPTTPSQPAAPTPPPPLPLL
jgi:hypothetical protein